MIEIAEIFEIYFIKGRRTREGQVGNDLNVQSIPAHSIPVILQYDKNRTCRNQSLCAQNGFLLCLSAPNAIWIHTSFTNLKWNMDSCFANVLKMEYGFIIRLCAQNEI